MSEGSSSDMSRETVLTLYTGEGCHLCDLARDILDEVLADMLDDKGVPAGYEVVSITGNDQLLAAYGVRIPVVRNKAGQEKGWPFTAGQVKKMVVS